MPRTPGAKNKTTVNESDSEDIFLSEMLRGYKFWKQQVAFVKEGGGTGEREQDYAEAYRVLLNRFSVIDDE